MIIVGFDRVQLLLGNLICSTAAAASLKLRSMMLLAGRLC